MNAQGPPQRRDPRGRVPVPDPGVPFRDDSGVIRARRPVVLLVSGRESIVTLVRNCVAALPEHRADLRVAADVPEVLRLRGSERASLTLLDLPAAGPPALEGLKTYREGAPRVPVVVLAEASGEQQARRSLRHGATDYLLTSEVSPRAVERCLRIALELSRAQPPTVMSAQLHHLQELLPCPVLLCRRSDGIVLYANPKVGPTFGQTSGQLLGRPAQHLFGEEGIWDFFLRSLGSQGFVDDIETRVRRSDGSFRDVRVSGLTLALEEGVGVLLFLYDTSAGRGGEKTLRDVESSFRQFFEENLTGNFRAAASGQILACNRAFSTMFGLRTEIGAPHPRWSLRDLHLSEASFRDFLQALEKQRRLEHYEATLQRADGTHVDVIQNVVGKFDKTGRLREIRGYLFDISEHKRTEKQLRQSQKMEAVGLLAGGIAHDFNNLLTAITGYSELILNRLAEEDPLRHDVQEIRNAGTRAAGLTKQLLAFSRKQILQPQILHLNDVVAEMDRMLRRLIGEDVQLVARLQRGLPPVKADRGQIEQVIVNLLLNARDAMPEGGSVVVETSIESYDRDRHRQGARIGAGRYVVLSISDTGTGIDPEIVPRVFEPFFTTKEKGKGTGLGLSTVYGIVKQSNGFIFVESTKNVGTTFEIYLTAVDADSHPSEEEETSRRKLDGNETILLVEDEPAVRELASLTLQMKGYRLLVAENGEQALGICREHAREIDLIVTDVVMPQMSGRELVERALELEPRLRVLYLSGYTDEAIGRHGLGKPNFSFMSKPFTPSGLAAKVREILDREPTTDREETDDQR